jgi:hypothetical protein
MPLVPGPPVSRIPFLGVLPAMLRPDFHRVVLDWANTYGGIYRSVRSGLGSPHGLHACKWLYARMRRMRVCNSHPIIPSSARLFAEFGRFGMMDWL